MSTATSAPRFAAARASASVRAAAVALVAVVILLGSAAPVAAASSHGVAPQSPTATRLPVAGAVDVAWPAALSRWAGAELSPGTATDDDSDVSIDGGTGDEAVQGSGGDEGGSIVENPLDEPEVDTSDLGATEAEDRQIWAVIGGLVLVAVALAALTVRYWQVTRPAPLGSAEPGAPADQTPRSSTRSTRSTRSGRRARSADEPAATFDTDELFIDGP
jgi:hypothetical protein